MALIPQTDPGAFVRAHRPEVMKAMERVLDSGWYILGNEVGAFEREFCAAFGYRHAVGVGNGTDALALALRALGLGEGSRVAILSLGTRLAEALRAADELAARGLPATVADARFAKPIDTALLEQLARHHEVLITIEEASLGGFSTQVFHHLALNGLLDGGLRYRPMVLPDRFIDHMSPAAQIADAALDSKSIVRTVLSALGRDTREAVNL